MKPLFLMSLALTFCVSVRAELPPDAYAKMQREAPESITIEVMSVKTAEKKTATGSSIAVTVEARVKKVERSPSALQPGKMIRIEYVHRKDKSPKPGPSETPILEKGKTYPAFLERKKGIYAPAAGGHSFHITKAPKDG